MRVKSTDQWVLFYVQESWSLKDIPTEMIRAFLGPKQTFAFVYFHNMEVRSIL